VQGRVFCLCNKTDFQRHEGEWSGGLLMAGGYLMSLCALGVHSFTYCFAICLHTHSARLELNPASATEKSVHVMKKKIIWSGQRHKVLRGSV